LYVTYQPKGEEPQIWEFDPDDVLVDEQIAVEKRAGQRWDAWVADCKLGDGLARKVLLWHLSRRRHPGLRYEDTPNFRRADLLVEQSVAELEANRDTWIAAGGESTDNAELILGMFEKEIDEARAKFGDGEEPGKALSSS
jgi:hypothetical protein